jgi:hypothetical protein
LAEQRHSLLPPPKALPAALVREAADQLSRDSLKAPMLGLRTKSNGMSALLDDPERRLSGLLRPKLPLVLHAIILTEHSIGAPLPHPQARPRPRTAAQLLSIIPIVAMNSADSADERAESEPKP